MSSSLNSGSIGSRLPDWDVVLGAVGLGARLWRLEPGAE
jgi:hypothetical protein